MQIKLWKTFAKRSNSTKLPPANADAIKSVYLKEDTSQENPVFVIDDVDWDWSYLEWNGHYYFVTDKVVGANNCYELHCRQDALTSHRADVLNTSAYIKYASSGIEGVTIPSTISDNRLAQFVNKTWSKTIGEGEIFSKTEMFYVLTVAGQSIQKRGMTNVYILTAPQLADLSRYIFNDLFNAHADLVDQIIKEFGDVFSAIVSLRTLPLNSTLVNSISSISSSVILGGVSTGIVCRQVNGDQVNVDEFEELPINIPVNDWRRQYVSMSLYLPLIGLVELSTSDFFNAHHIRVRYIISPTSGMINYLIYAETDDDNYIVAQYEAEFGYTLPISTTSTNIAGGISTIANGVFGSMLTTNPALSIVSTVTSSIPQMFGHSISTIGSQGNSSKLALPSNIQLFINYTPTVVEPSNIWSVMGRPVEKVDRVGNYTGYVQTINASVSGSMNDGDRTELNNLLNGGVFIE